MEKEKNFAPAGPGINPWAIVAGPFRTKKRPGPVFQVPSTFTRVTEGLPHLDFSCFEKESVCGKVERSESGKGIVAVPPVPGFRKGRFTHVGSFKMGFDQAQEG